MLTARIQIKVPATGLWFQGQTLEGAHGWYPSIIHPSALNFALCSALGVKGVRGRHLRMHEVGKRHLHHSLVHPGLWASPAEADPTTLRPVEETLVSISAQYGAIIAIPPGEGKQRVIVGEGGRLDYGNPGPEMAMGRPKRMTGWKGTWEGRVFRHPDVPFPEEVPLVLGPLDVEAILTVVSPWELVAPASNQEGAFADHLMDPALIPDHRDIAEAVGAMPWSLARVHANAQAGGVPIYSPWHDQV